MLCELAELSGLTELAAYAERNRILAVLGLSAAFALAYLLMLQDRKAADVAHDAYRRGHADGVAGRTFGCTRDGHIIPSITSGGTIGPDCTDADASVRPENWRGEVAARAPIVDAAPAAAVPVPQASVAGPP